MERLELLRLLQSWFPTATHRRHPADPRAFFWTDGYSTLLEAQLQSELQIAWAESAPSLSEFRAIQFIVAAGT